MDKNTMHNSGNNEDVQDLLNVLDRMQKRPRVAEVEEALVSEGRPDLARMDVYTVPKQEGFFPTATSEKLEDLLIAPGDNGSVYRTQVGQERKRVDDDADLQMMYGEEVDVEDWERVDPRPEQRTSVWVALLRGLKMTIPTKKDTLPRVLGKSGLWLGVLASVLVAVLLLGEMRLVPMRNNRLTEELRSLYNAEVKGTVADTKNYPVGMQASFKQLYDRNEDVRGWLSFHSTGDDFLDIEYPFVQGQDNSFYQDHDFDKNESDYGTLFVNADAEIGYYNTDKVLVIRGNNTPDQAMLSGLNRLYGPVEYSRTAPSLTLSTLYRRDNYYVFATMLTDGTGKDPFNPLKADFENEEEFLNYIQNLRTRSLFDYPVDVQYSDSFVLLAVPTGITSANLSDGMIIVAARRERYNYTEEEMHPNQIVKNKDALMPYSWYIRHNRTPKRFNVVEEGDDITTTTTTTTTTTIGDGTSTTDSPNPDGTLPNQNEMVGIQINKNTSLTTAGSTSAPTESTTSTTESTTSTTESTTGTTEQTNPSAR